jgi:hypothetical protein
MMMAVTIIQKKRKTHSPRSYHYKIGEYKSSTYYTKFLSDHVIKAPGGLTVTVREQTQRLSRNPKSTFRVVINNIQQSTTEEGER